MTVRLGELCRTVFGFGTAEPYSAMRSELLVSRVGEPVLLQVSPSEQERTLGQPSLNHSSIQGMHADRRAGHALNVSQMPAQGGHMSLSAPTPG
jgi:hypothetical protein